MGLIKSSHAPLSAAVFSMTDIEKQAQGLLVQARREADRILAAALVDAETIRAQARASGAAEGVLEGQARGHADGLRTGREEALKQMTQALVAGVKGLESAAGAIEASRRELEASAVHDVLELSLLIAERVTRRQGLVDRSVAIANVAEAVRLVTGASKVRIAVNPLDHQTLQTALPAIRMQMPKLDHVEVVADDTIGPGGCRLHTSGGEIDAVLETQLARV